VHATYTHFIQKQKLMFKTKLYHHRPERFSNLPFAQVRQLRICKIYVRQNGGLQRTFQTKRRFAKNISDKTEVCKRSCWVKVNLCWLVWKCDLWFDDDVNGCDAWIK